jgi:hypothetical protein
VTSLPNNESEKLQEKPPTDISRPVGDAVPTPVEPGMDQPLPEKPVSGENVPRDDATEKSTDAPENRGGVATSKPVGDAIPTPVDPGLDQPLPEKGAQLDRDNTVP